MRDVLRKGVILIALLVAVGFYAFFAPALVEMFLGQSSDVLSILLSAVVGIFAYVLFRFVLNNGEYSGVIKTGQFDFIKTPRSDGMRTPLATTSLTIEGSIEGGEPNTRRFTIVRIREALRLRELKVSNVQISRSIQCGRSTLIATTFTN